jgi:hypothetical protein
MRIVCRHGFFEFFEDGPGEVSTFMSVFGFRLSPFRNRFTFTELLDAETFSVEGVEYLVEIASKTYEGEPWDVMRENGLVFDFIEGKLVPILSIVESIRLSRMGNFYQSNGLILPGSLNDEGLRVTDYSAWYSWKTNTFRYSEVTYG